MHLISLSLSLFFAHIAHTIAPIRPSFPLSIPLSCPFFSAILYNDMPLAGCFELRPTVNLWIICPCS